MAGVTPALASISSNDRAAARLPGRGSPWEMIVDSSATTGRPAASAARTAGDIWETVGMDPTIPARAGHGPMGWWRGDPAAYGAEGHARHRLASGAVPPETPCSKANTKTEEPVTERTKFILDESQIPTQWYNIIPDLPAPPPPPLHPGTLQPVGPDDLAPLFPMELIRQEVTGESYVDIPGEVIDVYKLWRPTPLFRARRLEKLLNTPARIYYKYEGVLPGRVAQAEHRGAAGLLQLGRGHQAAHHRDRRRAVGQRARVRVGAVRPGLRDLDGPRVLRPEAAPPHAHADLRRDRAPVPVQATKAGLDVLASDPDSPGSLGIAISEAVEAAGGSAETRYALGSVLNHVLLHQTVIGQEALAQFELAGEAGPDLIVGCTGGGSNFAGLVFPFLREKLAGRMNPVIRAVEPSACPSFTRGLRL